MSNNNIVTLVSGNTGLFQHHSPVPDGIKAVKLTEDNIKQVGAYILKAIGGKVEITSTTIAVGGITGLSIGNYVVEEYDYVLNETTFRRATTEERRRYGLR